MKGLTEASKARGLGFATCVLAVAGIVVATEGTTFPAAAPPTVALTPAMAVLECAVAGPYRAPDRGSVGVPAGIELCSGAARIVTAASSQPDMTVA